MTSPLSPRAHDFHPIPVPIPEGQRTRASFGETAAMPQGSAVLSQSESDVDEPDWRYGSQPDASILYGQPQRRHKTRTMSAVRPTPLNPMRVSRADPVPAVLSVGGPADDHPPAQHVRPGAGCADEGQAHVTR